MNITKPELKKEATFKTSRSGGAGGQNVNKVSSKVEVIFNLADSQLFSDEEKVYMHSRLGDRIKDDGCIHIYCQEDRSQLLNKEKCMDKLVHLLSASLKREKPRKATKPSKAAIEKRLKAKQLKARKKISRAFRNED